MRTGKLLAKDNFRCMRVITNNYGWIGDLCDDSVWTGTGSYMSTADGGDLYVHTKVSNPKPFEDYFGFKIGEDVYFSIAYLPYTEDPEKQYLYDDFMKKNKTLDRVEYFLNGKMYSYTYMSKSSYKLGVDEWDNDTSRFYIGVCCGNDRLNLHYLKGDCYSLRLYDRTLSEAEVELNYNTNLKYRNSFKDDVLE